MFHAPFASVLKCLNGQVRIKNGLPLLNRGSLFKFEMLKSGSLSDIDFSNACKPFHRSGNSL